MCRKDGCGVDAKQLDCAANDEKTTVEEREFLYILKNERPTLLARLQDLELLPSFLEAERGTKREL